MPTTPFDSRRRRLADARPLYVLPEDSFAEELLIPAFAEARAASCMVGFFSSASLAEIAAGLASYIERENEPLKLIISPFLTNDDQRALEAGTKAAAELAAETLEAIFITATELQSHTLRCLTYLLAKKRIEIKIALLRNALFHPKVWLFDVTAGLMAAHGSSNMTASGIRQNFEQVTVSRAWEDPTQRYIATKLKEQFERLWSKTDPACFVVDLPEAIEKELLRNYPSTRPPTEEDFLNLYRRVAKSEMKEASSSGDLSLPTKPVFAVPSHLQYDSGPFAHQGRAVRAWLENGYRGTLEMATGSGKTLTAMIAAFKLYEQRKPLFIVVAAPYVPLIQQWCDEISPFGLIPLNLTEAGGAAARAAALSSAGRRLRLGISTVEIAVVSHDTLCTADFKNAVEGFECDRLLIADEAHNLGRGSFTNDPPHLFEHRLALSATPVRQYDDDGTALLFEFFGPVVFRFTLKEAIGVCLVPYDYFIHPVHLTTDEMEEWAILSKRIRENAWRTESGRPDDFLAKLLRDRRALLETASSKVQRLSSLLDKENLPNLKHALIYASDKGPQQLEEVNDLLRRKGVLFHQLTAEETADRAKTTRILRSFQEGEIQVLTAKRVLDEGVNIPQIRRAYILASTTVERQWIQRRGRLLRKCAEIGKNHSTIHDFLALPPQDQPWDADARAVLVAELRRAQEFASLARNAGLAGGALDVIHPLITEALQ